MKNQYLLLYIYIFFFWTIFFTILFITETHTHRGLQQYQPSGHNNEPSDLDIQCTEQMTYSEIRSHNTHVRKCTGKEIKCVCVSVREEIGKCSPDFCSALIAPPPVTHKYENIHTVHTVLQQVELASLKMSALYLDGLSVPS